MIQPLFLLVSMTITLAICSLRNYIYIHCLIHCIVTIFLKCTICSIFCLIYSRVFVKINLYQCQCQCQYLCELITKYEQATVRTRWAQDCFLLVNLLLVRHVQSVFLSDHFYMLLQLYGINSA